MLYEKLRKHLTEITDHEHAKANDNRLSQIATGQCCLSNQNGQDYSHQGSYCSIKSSIKCCAFKIHNHVQNSVYKMHLHIDTSHILYKFIATTM